MEFLFILLNICVILAMQYNGTLLKMETKLANPVEYELPIGDELIYMNNALPADEKQISHFPRAFVIPVF